MATKEAVASFSQKTEHVHSRDDSRFEIISGYIIFDQTATVLAQSHKLFNNIHTDTNTDTDNKGTPTQGIRVLVGDSKKKDCPIEVSRRPIQSYNKEY